jgi:hypothetical protein
MTPRTLRWTAFSVALASQLWMVIGYGSMTGWCYCAILTAGPAKIPPTWVQRFTEVAALPATTLAKGLPVQGLFLFGLIGWFIVLVPLLEAMVLVARLRARPVRVRAADRDRPSWLVPRESVRPLHLLAMGMMLIGVGMTAGAMERRAWLAEAEQVFAATMTAASTGRPLPPGVEFSMMERRGDEYVHLDPEPGFTVDVDPRESGDHFLDRFVVPYAYGGWVRFTSGARYELVVLSQVDGWSVDLYEENAFRRRGGRPRVDAPFAR